jgi:uncharacterized protein YigA (DUF484 family)
MTALLDSVTVAQYLADHPHFFEEYAGLLGEVRLASPVTGKAVSLQERQLEVMRDKYRALELRVAELVRLAQENQAIAGRFHAWNQVLLKSRGSDGARPARRPGRPFQRAAGHAAPVERGAAACRRLVRKRRFG